MSVTADPSVRKSITVATSVARAFEVFTAEFDSWWPRSHHIGKSPMTHAWIEGVDGGRCYTSQEDGTECDWGKVLAWEPPHRLVIAWMIAADWSFEPDMSKTTEVEIRFTATDDGRTRVDLEHRFFERMPGGDQMRQGVSAPGGWGSLLDLYAAKADGVPRATPV
jgi:uncharacterized protein YndB with AHSA1/START domain